MSEADLSQHLEGLFAGISDEANEGPEDAPFRDRFLESMVLGLDDALFLGENGRPGGEWEAFLANSDRTWAYEDGPEGLRPAGEAWTEAMEAAVTAGELATGRGEDNSWLAIPIQVQGHTIGVLELDLDDPEREWSPEESGMIEAIVAQAAQALEKARLEATREEAGDSEE